MLMKISIFLPGEFRKLLAAFVSGSASKAGGLIRKITPTSAEPRGPSIPRSQQTLSVIVLFHYTFISVVTCDLVNDETTKCFNKIKRLSFRFRS